MRTLIALAILLISGLSAHAQDEMGAIALKYPFLDTSANHLEFHGNRKGMDELYERLDRVLFEQDGKINIVHMGGSHVQGGTLSHTLRSQLGQLAPELNVERGFFFPHRLANTNMVLADGKVLFQGQEVAFVVAEDRYAAADGIEAVEVEYEELPVIVDPFEALQSDVVLRPDTVGEDGSPADGAHGPRKHHNHIFTWECGDKDPTEQVI